MSLKILGGRFKGRNIKTPSGDTTRPTQSVVRAALFNRCQQEIDGARFLDLFAGSGAMGLEALSRGAQNSVFVERNRQAAQCIRENLSQLNTQADVWNTDARIALKKLADRKIQFDLIYIDPPYDQPLSFYEEIFSLLIPLLTSQTRLFLEEREGKTITIPGWREVDRRRFGIALLTEYTYSPD